MLKYKKINMDLPFKFRKIGLQNTFKYLLFTEKWSFVVALFALFRSVCLFVLFVCLLVCFVVIPILSDFDLLFFYFCRFTKMH